MSDNTNNVTIHVGSQSDEGTMGTSGIDVVDFAGGDDTGGGGATITSSSEAAAQTLS